MGVLLLPITYLLFRARMMMMKLVRIIVVNAIVLAGCVRSSFVRALDGGAKEPDLKYVFPDDYANVYDSEYCTTLYEKDSCPSFSTVLINVTWGRVEKADCPALLGVKKDDDCGIVNATQYEEVSRRLNGTIFPFNIFESKCKQCASFPQFSEPWPEPLRKLGVRALVQVTDKLFNEAYFVPGYRTYYMAGTRGCSKKPLSFPWIQCGRKPPPLGGINYTANVTQINSKTLFTLKTSPNRKLFFLSAHNFPAFITYY